MFIVAGGSMISNFSNPADAVKQAGEFALAIGIVFLVEGVVAFVNGLANRAQPLAGWAIANGVITFILGLLIIGFNFWERTWVLGTLVGISFLFSGIELIAFSASIDEGQDPPAIA